MGEVRSAGMSPSARLYQWFVDIGSDVNRLINPNPERLARPLSAAQIARLHSPKADPVVIVGGYASAPASLEPLERSLRADGFTNVFVFEVPNNGLADIRFSARKLREFVEMVKRKTGAKRVDLVAHSAGGIVARTFAQFVDGDRRSVDQIVTIATPHHGVKLLRQQIVNSIADSRFGRWLVGPSTHQLLTGSKLLTALEEDRQNGGLDTIRLLSIFVDGFDGLLAPLDTGIVAGERNVRMTHPLQSVGQARLGHFTLHRRSNDVYEVVRAFLLQSSPR